MLEAFQLISIGISVTLTLGFAKRKRKAPLLYWIVIFLLGIGFVYHPMVVPAILPALLFSLRGILGFLFYGKQVIHKNWAIYFLILPLLYFILSFIAFHSYFLSGVLIFELYSSAKQYRMHLLKKGITLSSNTGLKVWWVFGFTALNLLLVGSMAMSPWISWFTLPAQLSFIAIGFLTLATFLRENIFGSLFMSSKYEKSSIEVAERYRLGLAIEQVLREGTFHASFDATLSKLAQLVKGTTHQVSQVINESKGMTFGELVAYHRIKDAKKLLSDKNKHHLSVEGIASEVGYASKAAFNKAFKKFTGKSPSEFRKSHVLPDQEVPLQIGKTQINREPARTFEAIKNSRIMLSNFLKIFFRNLSRNGLFSFLNLLGLTVGFTCSILIYLFIQDERSYDKQIPDHENIYRIAWQNDNPQTRTPHPMAQAMVQDFPEVAHAVSISPWYGPGLTLDPIRVKNPEENIAFEEEGIFFADSTFLDVFQLEVIAGDEKALHEPALIISSTLAKKYFGDSSAIGRQLEFNGFPLNVAAVVTPLPEKSHFHFNAIISYVAGKRASPDNAWYSWTDFGHFNYIRLKKGADHEALAAKIPEWVSNYLNWSSPSIESLKAGNEKFILQPIASIHLNSHLRWELETNGNAAYIYILSATLLFLLLIAVINYVNLTTAKSVERAKEVGIRKTLGGTTKSLSTQFYFETIVFSIIAMGLSLLCAGALMDGFNQLSEKSFSLGDLLNTSFLLKVLVLCVLVGMTAAFYPAIALSSFEPVKVLKGKLSTGSKGSKLRSSLVIIQFAVSAIMISGSLMIFRQVQFMKNKDMGFDKEAVIALNVPRDVSAEEQVDLSKWRIAQKEMEQLSGVNASALSGALIGDQINQFTFYLEEQPDNRVDASFTMVDFGYEELMNMELVVGRYFDRSHELDSSSNVHINETLANALGGDVIGKKLIEDRSSWKTARTITGVIKDFHFQSLHSDIQPIVVEVFPQAASNLMIKLNGSNVQETIASIQSIYEEMIDDELPFEYQFLDQSLAELYTKEEKTLSIFSIFSGIALILASLGLLGMALAVLNQRIKEVGVRKILGASSFQILHMVLSQFLKLIGIALLIGLPVSSILMEFWAQEFTYRAPLNVVPFLTSSVILITVATFSISSAVLKISFSNPANVLRYE